MFVLLLHPFIFSRLTTKDWKIEINTNISWRIPKLSGGGLYLFVYLGKSCCVKMKTFQICSFLVDTCQRYFPGRFTLHILTFDPFEEISKGKGKRRRRYLAGLYRRNGENAARYNLQPIDKQQLLLAPQSHTWLATINWRSSK